MSMTQDDKTWLVDLAILIVWSVCYTISPSYFCTQEKEVKERFKELEHR
jgi:hypothetical protein